MEDEGSEIPESARGLFNNEQQAQKAQDIDVQVIGGYSTPTKYWNQEWAREITHDYIEQLLSRYGVKW